MRIFTLLIFSSTFLILLSCSTTPKQSFSLAKQYHNGEGTEKDVAKAKEHYLKACNEGNIFEACFLAGKLTQKGDQPSKENNEARTLFEKACKGDYHEACFTIAEMWATGTGGVMKDGYTARQKYKAICDKKFAKGCRALSDMFIKGDGGDKNIKTAISLRETACEYNDYKSCDEIGDVWFKRQGQDGSREK